MSKRIATEKTEQTASTAKSGKKLALERTLVRDLNVKSQVRTGLFNVAGASCGVGGEEWEHH